jgi:hypothetical protein
VGRHQLVEGRDAYDAARSRVVLFGGDADTMYSDTWEWDGRSWSERQPATRPQARTGHAMVYDSARQRTVLFGGSGLRDTWEWDGTNWTQRNPPASPAGRSNHAMAYDSVRQRTVLFGGSGSEGPEFSDTWEWDGTTWTQRLPAVAPQGARAGHAMAYDAARQRTVMVAPETWEWDGTTWRQLAPPQSPRAKTGHAMAYDSARQRTVLFGGLVGSALAPLAETWEWDGTTWLQRQTSTQPTGRTEHAMAYDSARGCVVAFGGGNVEYGHGTWRYGLLAPASATRVGYPCRGSNGWPVLTGNAPFVGSPAFVLDLLSARASAPCVFGLAAQPDNVLLQNGCLLYLKHPIVPLAATSDALGFASLKLAVPVDPTLGGGTLHAQAFILDPLGGALGFVATPARALVIGD